MAVTLFIVMKPESLSKAVTNKHIHDHETCPHNNIDYYTNTLGLHEDSFASTDAVCI